MRLVRQAMEDLSVLYDHSVRSSTGNLVQFRCSLDSWDNMIAMCLPLPFIMPTGGAAAILPRLCILAALHWQLS